MKIGFIGLGFMGEGMAANILAKGHSLTILGHKNRAPIERLAALGAVEVQTPKEVAQASDVIFMCVTGSPQVEANVRGEKGLAAGGKKGLIIVDCSTSNPVSTLALYEELKPLGITFVDAPLGGTPVQAKEGTLAYDQLHAYLHRKEGDRFNANYWYRRCGENMPKISLEEEWEILVERFLEKKA